MFWYVLDAGFTEMFSQISWDYTSKTGKYAASSCTLGGHIHHKLGVTKNGVFKMRSNGPMDLSCVMKVPFLSAFSHESFAPIKYMRRVCFFFLRRKKVVWKGPSIYVPWLQQDQRTYGYQCFFLLIGVGSFLFCLSEFLWQMKISQRWTSVGAKWAGRKSPRYVLVVEHTYTTSKKMFWSSLGVWIVSRFVSEACCRSPVAESAQN